MRVFNCAARGTGGPDIIYALAKGETWFRVVETVRYDLVGDLPHSRIVPDGNMERFVRRTCHVGSGLNSPKLFDESVFLFNLGAWRGAIFHSVTRLSWAASIAPLPRSSSKSTDSRKCVACPWGQLNRNSQPVPNAPKYRVDHLLLQKLV